MNFILQLIKTPHKPPYFQTMKTKIPTWLESFVITHSTFFHDDEDHEYAVVASTLATNQGAPEVFAIMNGEVLAISEAYPEEYRELGLIHELVCNTTKEEDCHICLRSLQYELDLARERGLVMVDYINFRSLFFENLIKYYEAKNETVVEVKILEKMRHSLAHLKNL